ncbi:MAG TPA: efflux RND transporter periplasmic adaptor subunit [Gammaproteobacteria bacterium]
MNRLKTIALIILLAQSVSSFAEEIQGTLVWGQRMILGFPVTGVIADLNVQAGSHVKQKQLLARLDNVPFDSQVKKFQSNIDRLEPMIFDAQQDFDQAQELYDRTVLSEVELLKAEVKLKGLKAEQAMAKADLELAQWQRKQSQLIAPFDAIVINSNLAQGMIVSQENQSELRIELAKAGLMQVQLKVTADTLATITMNQPAQVVIGSSSYKASVKRIEPVSDASGMHSVQVEFSHPVDRSFIARQAAKVVF